MIVECPNCRNKFYHVSKLRSSSENRYFHGVVLPILEDYTGHTADQLKVILKKKFGWMTNTFFEDQVYEVPMSSADMSTADFEKFMSQIRMWGDTIGVFIPEPNSINAFTE